LFFCAETVYSTFVEFSFLQAHNSSDAMDKLRIKLFITDILKGYTEFVSWL
jgi:hypothetical protein